MKKAFIPAIFFLCLFCLSCRKKPKSDIDPLAPTDVYVTLSNTYNSYGQYWKNGEIVNLATTNSFANARAIFVSENDIHVVGDASATSNIVFSPFTGQYWYNGTVSNVDGSIPAKLLYDVVVSDGDVFMAGDGLNTVQLRMQAACWKDGVAIPLEEADTRGSRARGIFVAGKDVYVAGSLDFQDQTAVYWKNGIAVHLGDPINTSFANAIAVSGKNIHVVGSEGFKGGSRARYWKNGAGNDLTDGSEYSSEAVDIAVSGKDVYCVGNLQYHDNTRVAKLWKNGVAQSLPGAIRVSSVFVFNNDVYVAGEGSDLLIKRPMYWKNGEPVILANIGPGAFASSIFVKKTAPATLMAQ